jgi:hypothetical protein
MTADRLLRLYPRAWRERYGDEFLALVGDRPLGFPQLIDIVSGAIDAHLSSDVRAMTARGQTTAIQGGTAVIDTLKASCIHDKEAPFSKRDAWIGSGVLVGGVILLSALGILLNRSGLNTVGESIKGAAFPVSALLSMPFTFVKKQSWKAQAVLVGIPVVIVLFLAYLATLI